MIKTIAFVPVRGGSKSIHLKNIKDFNGKPLVYWILLAASNSDYIHEVVVSTDSDKIKAVVEGFHFKKVIVVDRNPILAEDSSSTESVMLDYAINNEFDNIILLQATSPLTTLKHINEAFNTYIESSADSLISLVKTHRFLWKIEKDFVIPLNYNYTKRPRRQDWNGQLVENGAIYISKRPSLIRSRSRISGNIIPYLMPEYTYYEIDEPADWIILESLHKKYALV
jgi:CMP-N-acetylneuraminic acid synthetase